MSSVLHKPQITDFQPEVIDAALDDLRIYLTLSVKPKARERAVAKLTDRANKLDNHNRAGRVVNIRAPRSQSAHEQELKARADAIRYLIGRAF